MNAITWPAVITEDGKLLVDDRKGFRAYVGQWKGDAVEIVVRPKPKRQSDRKRGYYRAEIVPAFRAHLELRFRRLVEDFREHYGAFTYDYAHDTLVRLVEHIPEDVERVSTAIDAMNDDEYGGFLFRVCGYLTLIECPFRDAERDPVRRLERAS